MTQAIDMTAFIAAKSDQLNADDLLGGPRTITISRVTGNEGNVEQPVNVFFEGDDGKPFRPCKSMRRVMVNIWGADASQYAGRSMTVYRDPEVTWGGMKVGGIRISHMSHMDGEQVMSLMASKKARKPYTVKPLKVEQPAADNSKAIEAGEKVLAAIGRAPDPDTLGQLMASKQRTLALLEKDVPELAQAIRDAAAARFADPTPAQNKAAELVAAFEAAEDGAAFTAAETEFGKHRDGFNDDERATVEAAMQAALDRVDGEV